MARSDLYISVDIEADGPIPGDYSMSSFGAVTVATFNGTTFSRYSDEQRRTFYSELQPISELWQPEAAAVSGLDRDQLITHGEAPVTAMKRFNRWVLDQLGDEYRPVLVEYPYGYDWMWLYWYLMKFNGSSPFGFSGGLPMKPMYQTKANVVLSKATKRSIPKHLRSSRLHTHNALDDAQEQGDLFCNLFEWQPDN